MERWDAGAMDIVTTPISLFKISARTLYQRSRGKPQNASARSARMAYDIFRDCFSPEDCGTNDLDGFEYWSIVDACLASAQRVAEANGT
jgi:hypothetical protein